MNLIVKTAVGGVLALSASGAFAAYTIPSSGQSDLILVVENTSTLATYLLDTGISMDSVLPTGSLITGASVSTALAGVNATIAASAGLQAFLAANPAASDGWELEGAQFTTTLSTSGSSRTPGFAKTAFTSVLGTTNNAIIGGQQLNNLALFGNGVNNDTVSPGGLAPLVGNTETTSGSISSNAVQKYGTVSADSLAALGASNQLFAMTANSTTGRVQSYIQGTATLAANGTLTIVGNGAPVPLPAAVWLLGSGLMGLVGVSRRRKATV